MIRVLSTDDLTEDICNELKQLISNSMSNHEQLVVLSDNYEIVTSVMIDIVKDLLYNNFYLYCSCNSWSLSGVNQTIDNVSYTIATKVKVYYVGTEEAVQSNLNIINSQIEEIIKPLTYTNSNIDKILYVNNYFVKKNYSIGSGHIYNIITNKIGTIAHYTRLCKEIFDRLGIANKYMKISNNTDNAIGEWLIIKNNDDWYNFGIGFTKVGAVTTNHFEINTYNLKSDEYIFNLIGYETTSKYIGVSFEEDIKCLNTKYDWLINEENENGG